MKINKINTTEPEEDSPERQMQAALEAFDPTGRARLESLDKIAQRLADASRGLSSIDVTEEDCDENVATFKQASQDLNVAMREARQVMTGMEALVRNVIQEMVGVIQAVGLNEANLFDLNNKAECLRIALENKGAVSKEELKQAFEDEVKPALMQHLRDAGMLKEEDPSNKAD